MNGIYLTPLLRGAGGVFHKKVKFQIKGRRYIKNVTKKNHSIQSLIKTIARNLRNNSTMSEIILWSKLKGKQMMGFDFHRQKPLDNFIVDFFCNELMLAIE